MFYLPRICEHCLNPSCAASCPSGAIYKRDRGRHRPGRPGPLPRLADVRDRLPVQEGLLQPPHRQGREVHLLLPAHRGRHPHRLLRDLRRAGCATSGWCSTTPTGCWRPRPPRTSTDLYEAQRQVFLDPHDPAVIAAAERAGIPRDWIEAAQRSPVHALINTYQVALPLHPEYRTMPMVWYIPPLSPVVDVVRTPATTPRTAATCSPPSTPCASRSTTSPSCSPPATRPGRRGAAQLAAMRSYMRDINLGRDPRRVHPGRRSA